MLSLLFHVTLVAFPFSERSRVLSFMTAHALAVESPRACRQQSVRGAGMTGGACRVRAGLFLLADMAESAFNRFGMNVFIMAVGASRMGCVPERGLAVFGRVGMTVCAGLRTGIDVRGMMTSLAILIRVVRDVRVVGKVVDGRARMMAGRTL